jgi:hypothetical protein
MAGGYWKRAHRHAGARTCRFWIRQAASWFLCYRLGMVVALVFCSSEDAATDEIIARTAAVSVIVLAFPVVYAAMLVRAPAELDQAASAEVREMKSRVEALERVAEDSKKKQENGHELAVLWEQRLDLLERRIMDEQINGWVPGRSTSGRDKPKVHCRKHLLCRATSGCSGRTRRRGRKSAPMARRSVKNVMPAPSNRATDKLKAAPSYTYGETAARGTKTSRYVRAPFYYDALWQWYQTLNADRRELVRHIVDAWSFLDRRETAENCAAHLPPAPKCSSELE